MKVFQPDWSLMPDVKCLFCEVHTFEKFGFKLLAQLKWFMEWNHSIFFPYGGVTCTILGTFTTLYSAAWVFSYKFWLLSPLTGFRTLYGDGFHKDFCEERCSWLGKKKKKCPFHRLPPAGTSACCACWNEATSSSPWALLSCWVPAAQAWATVLLPLLYLHY